MRQSGSQGDADNVVDERPKQILSYHANGVVRQLACISNTTQVVAHKRHLRNVHCHIGATAHGNAHIGKCKSLRVVDAVANHCHTTTLTLQTTHNVLLVLRQTLALPMGYSSLLSPISGSLLLVATHHPYLYATCLEHGYCLGSMGLQLLAILKRNVGCRTEINITIRNGQRACLVDNECVYTAELLYGCSILNQNALLRRLAYANHQGGRCSESHSTRTGYDQYRHGRQNGLRKYCRSAYSKPQHKG